MHKQTFMERNAFPLGCLLFILIIVGSTVLRENQEPNRRGSRIKQNTVWEYQDKAWLIKEDNHLLFRMKGQKLGVYCRNKEDAVAWVDFK